MKGVHARALVALFQVAGNGLAGVQGGAKHNSTPAFHFIDIVNPVMMHVSLPSLKKNILYFSATTERLARPFPNPIPEL